MTMTAATTNVAAIQGLLKYVYEPAIREDIQNEFLPYKRLEDKTKKVNFTGKAWVFEVEYKRSGAIRAGSDGGAVPKAANYGYVQGSVTPSIQIGAHQWSHMATKIAKDSKGSFADLVQREVTKLKNDMVHSIARQMFGTGDSVITNLSAASNISAASGTLHVDDTTFFAIGMRLDVTDASYTSRISIGDCAVVAYVDHDNKTLTVTPGSGTTLTISSTADGDKVIVYESYDTTNGVSLEMTGLQQIINDSGTLHGLDLSTYPWWKAQVMGNGGTPAALTSTRLNKILQRMVTVGGYPTIAYMSFGVYNSLCNLLVSRQRYNDEIELDGGLKVKTWMGPKGPVPIYPDWMIPRNRIFLPDEALLGKLTLGEPEFISGDNQKIMHFNTSYLKFDSVLVYYTQLYTPLRTRHGLLEDIIEDSE